MASQKRRSHGRRVARTHHSPARPAKRPDTWSGAASRGARSSAKTYTADSAARTGTTSPESPSPHIFFQGDRDSRAKRLYVALMF